MIDPGLLKTLRDDIVPRLLNDISGQPSQEELEVNTHRCRFVLVFDREGYSPAFFRDMWKNHRIGYISYHKHPQEVWPDDWFVKHEVTMPNGEIVTMHLAEMGSLVGSGKDSVWMREVRKLTDSGHQTSLISTFHEPLHTVLATHLFSRWCQENFFRYMMQHFAIDLLQEYGTEDFTDTEQVVNLDEGKSKLKKIPKRISWAQLGEKDRFSRLLPGRKRLMDTVRMIAYRAETAMAALLVSSTVDLAAARCLLQNLFVTEADILPDPENKLLLLRIHSASRPAANRLA